MPARGPADVGEMVIFRSTQARISISQEYRYTPKSMKKPTRRNAAPQEVSEVLARALGRTGLAKEINRYRFVLHWEEIVGKEIARFAHPEGFKDGRLIVSVMTSAWAQELSFHREVILSRLRKFAGDELEIKDLIFQVGEQLRR